MNKLFIWEDRGLFLGKLPDMSEHRLGAAALCLGLDRPFRVLESESSDSRECRSMLVPPGCLHEVFTAGAGMAVIFLEPESEHYALLRSAMQEDGECQCLYDLAQQERALAIATDLLQRPCDAETAYERLDDIIDPERTMPDAHHALDARILRVIQLIKEDVSQSYSVEALAERVNLSATRLVHLFKEQTGVPIRRFRQWNRMKAVAGSVAEGGTLTDAALNAGFSDSAHFSRAFRNMFGTKPSLLFNRAAELEIIIG